MNEELKACPKCGSSDVDWMGRGKEIEIKCHACQLSYRQKRLRISHNELLEIMIKKWNTRPLEDALTAERDALAEKLELAETTIDTILRFHKVIIVEGEYCPICDALIKWLEYKKSIAEIEKEE